MQEAPQEEQQGNSFVPAIVNHNEQEAAPTSLPAMPSLETHSESETEAEPSAEDMALAQDPEMVKLNQALEAVKEDIIANGKQIADERKWVAAVLKITQDYEMKVKRVQDHILELRKTMKTLYEKKKQIENLKLQRALEAKLKMANEELITLQNSLKHVQAKHEELDKSHMDLRSTIASIEAQLAKLKGENPEKADQEEKVEIEEAVEADKLESASEKEEASILGSEEEKEAMEI
jgi:predicted  nucleic acid-binding Zn-ribbon protein